MARLINIIYKPHLVTYPTIEGKDAPTCCGVCEYKAIIEGDYGDLFVYSILDDSGIRELDVNKAVNNLLKEEDGEADIYKPYEHIVSMDEVNKWTEGNIEVGVEPYRAMMCVFLDILESGCNCTEEVRAAAELYKHCKK